MGYFSNCCAKTNLPVLAHLAWELIAPRLTTIVVLEEGRKPYTVQYDGYGLNMDDDFDDAKLVLADVYKGEKWADLPKSNIEPNQGIFHDKAFIIAIAARPNGFASYDDYFDALGDYERESEGCLATAMLSLDVPPPETLYTRMAEYLGYIAEKHFDQAAYYADRNYEVLEWLTGTQDERFVQAERVMAVLAEESSKVAEAVLANYPEPA